MIKIFNEISPKQCKIKYTVGKDNYEYTGNLYLLEYNFCVQFEIIDEIKSLIEITYKDNKVFFKRSGNMSYSVIFENGKNTKTSINLMGKSMDIYINHPLIKATYSENNITLKYRYDQSTDGKIFMNMNNILEITYEN